MKKIVCHCKKWLQNEKLFCFSYILCIFFSSLCFVEYAFLGLTALHMVWAFYFIKKKCLNRQFLKNMRYSVLLLLFLASGVITAFINKNNHLLDNLVLMYHSAICFLLLYGMHTQRSQDDAKNMMFQLFRMLTICINVLAVAGIILLITVVRVDAFGYTIGLYDNRFTGLYTHPNIAAFISMIGIIGCHLLYKRKNPVTKTYYLPKWFCILGFVIHPLTIWFADSNASFVYTCVYFFIYICIKKDVIHNIEKKNLMRVLWLTTAFVLCNYGLRISCQNGMMTLLNQLHTPEYTASDSLQMEDGLQMDYTEIEIGRTEQQDLSSGRLDSFQKAFLLFEVKPLMGVGKANIVPYGEQYLVSGFRFFDLHNGYLTILLSCGLVGFELFMLFLISLLRKAYYLLKDFSNISENDQTILSVFISALLGYGVYALFERTILFDITFMVTIFWVILGQFISCAIPYENEQERTRNPLKDLSHSLQTFRNFIFRLK